MKKMKSTNITTLLPSITIALLLNRLFMFSLLARISPPISGYISYSFPEWLFNCDVSATVTSGNEGC